MRLLRNCRLCIFLSGLIDSEKISQNVFTLGDSRNYMPPILFPSSAKRIATQILAIAKLNGTKDFIFKNIICDIICPSEKLPVQS